MKASARLAGLLAVVVLAASLVLVAKLLDQNGRESRRSSLVYGEKRSDSESSGLVGARFASTSNEMVERSRDRGRRVPLEVIVTTRDLTGEAVPEIAVRLGVASEAEELARITTDESGRSEFDLPIRPSAKRKGQRVWAELAAEGYPRLRVERSISTLHLAGDPVRLELVAELGRTIEGRVVDAEGNGVDHAELRLGHAIGQYTFLNTDQQGGWYVHVRPALDTLWLHARRSYTGASELMTIDVNELPEGQEVTVQLEGPRTIGGRVVDTLGFPSRRTGVEMRLRALPERLGEHGVVEFERHGGLAFTTVSMSRKSMFSAKGLQREDYALMVDDIELRPAGGDGSLWILPVAGFYVEVSQNGVMVSPDQVARFDAPYRYVFSIARCDEHGFAQNMRTASTNETPDGRLAVRVREPGEYVLLARNWTTKQLFQQRVTLPARGDHPVVQVDFDSGAHAFLRPRMPEGATVFDHNGNATTDWSRYSYVQLTDLSTNWLIDYYDQLPSELELPPGTYLIELQTFYGPEWIARVTLRPGETREVELVEQIGSALDLVFEGRGKLPIVGCHLVDRSDGTARRLELDPDTDETAVGDLARFVQRVDVVPGSYELRAKIGDEFMPVRTLDLAAGESRRVNFEW